MTSLPFGIDRPGPADKQGYASNPSRSLSEIEYNVNHSLEGHKSNVMNALNAPSRRASWSATVMLDGTCWRHYDLEAITWASGGKEYNIKGFAVEYEGMAPTPITDEQVVTAKLIWEFLEEKCPNLGAPVLDQGFQEHGRLTGATACPSDRIRWDDIAAEPEVEPEPIKEEGMYILADGSGKRWMLQGDGRKRSITNTQLQSYFAVGIPGVTLTPAQVKAIPDVVVADHTHGGVD